MVIQNLHISHDCKGRLDPTPFPITTEELVENYTFPEFTPYGTSAHARFIFFVTEILFITVIVLGNLMIVLAIWIKSNLRTPGFMYIVSVAISHFLIGVVVIPMYIIGHIPQQHLTTFQCKMVEYISCVASAASPYSAVALATHRFREKVIITTQEITYKQVVVDSCIVWGFSLLYASKAIVMYDMVTEIVLEEDNVHCVSMCEVPHSFQVLSNWFLIFDFVLLYIVPFLLMLTLYFILGVKLWTSTTDEDINAVKDRDNLTSTIVLLLAVFFCCFLGIYCWNMYVYWGPGHFKDSLLWREILKMISFITGWSNVVLVLCFNGTFRKTVLKTRRKPRHVGVTESNYLDGRTREVDTTTNFKEIPLNYFCGNNIFSIERSERVSNMEDGALAHIEPSICESDNLSEYDNVSYKGNRVDR